MLLGEIWLFFVKFKIVLRRGRLNDSYKLTSSCLYKIPLMEYWLLQFRNILLTLATPFQTFLSRDNFCHIEDTVSLDSETRNGISYVDRSFTLHLAKPF